MENDLVKDIKFNCDVSDAKYWGYFSICGLLMRYRDLFRSERGLAPWDEIRREEIAEWIHRKESRWPELEAGDFRDLMIGGRKYRPFDARGINEALRPRGLLYGAGYGMYLKPTFFLAELAGTAEIDGHPVFTADREYARDLFTTAGMLQDRCIFIRLEPLTVLLWEKYQESRSRPGSALARAFTRYGLEGNSLPGAGFRATLHHMAEQEAALLLRHELAESLEGVPEWKDILADAGDRNVEHFVRAVKDLIADTSAKGPLRRIIETRDEAGLSLALALLDGYRRLLFPGLREAAEQLFRDGDWEALDAAREAGYGRFLSLRQDIIGRYRSGRGKEEFARSMRSLIRGLFGEREQHGKKERG